MVIGDISSGVEDVAEVSALEEVLEDLWVVEVDAVEDLFFCGVSAVADAGGAADGEDEGNDDYGEHYREEPFVVFL